ncbi:MAG TPA: hypothetical protein P5526_18390 [Anaerolineae bacterium]|nr:hypothetical protein [Anaerolineae bacterium]HRV94135.1 hypothetical protein [Anaerolineae bacterium]
MTTSLTIELPETLTEQLQVYGISQQQVQTLVTTFMQNYLHQYQAQYAAGKTISSASVTSLPPEVKTALADLDQASNEVLWDIAQTAVAQIDFEKLESLLDKQKTTGLTATEQAQAQELLSRYDQAVLMRAKAIALLKQRGRDVSPLLQQPVDS